MKVQFNSDPSPATLMKDAKNGDVFELLAPERPRDHRNFFMKVNMGTSSASQAICFATGLFSSIEPTRPIRLHPQAKVVIDDVPERVSVQPVRGSTEAESLGATIQETRPTS